VSELKNSSIASSPVAIQYSKLDDYKQLVKLRLNLFVVFSALASYIIVAKWQVSLLALVLLGIGGFLITGAANALNQVLEKDYDKLMKRTANRPLAAGRMSVSEAVLSAGFMCMFGLTLLALFNPLAAFLGSIAVVSYAFIYTPVKRISTIAVAIGAFPGALPVLIGAVAFEGRISPLALVLFGIQFLWQFPHFWSIGWLGFEDYNRAGYKLVPASDGNPDKRIGIQSVLYTALILPLLLFGFWIGSYGITAMIISFLLTLGYTYAGWTLHKNSDLNSAKNLMFASFAYLPLIMITILSLSGN
jgi:heme o synthase